MSCFDKIKRGRKYVHRQAENLNSSDVCEVTQSCPALCDPVDCSLPGSSLHGIFQARILKWVAISFSGDIPDPGIKSGSPTLRVDALTSEPPEKPTTYEFPVTQPVLDRDKIFMTSILCVSMPLIEAEGMVAVEIVSWTEIQPPFGAFILWDHGVKII